MNISFFFVLFFHETGKWTKIWCELMDVTEKSYTKAFKTGLTLSTFPLNGLVEIYIRLVSHLKAVIM